MSKGKQETGPLSRRPDNSAFKQQRLPAWSPMLTANTVLPSFYFMALICLVLGVWLLIEVKSTQEQKVSAPLQKKKNVLYLWIGCSWNSQTAQVCDIAEADCS